MRSVHNLCIHCILLNSSISEPVLLHTHTQHMKTYEYIFTEKGERVCDILLYIHM